MKTKEEILKDCNIQVEILQEEKPMLMHNILKAMDNYADEVGDFRSYWRNSRGY